MTSRRLLKDLQDLGHEIVFVIGDFTAMIGDPSGKSKTRPSLTFEETRKSGETYFNQVTKILDAEKTKIVYNSEWLGKMSFEDVIKLTGKYTVARILERDDFSNRFNNNIPIGIHEFLYPLMQMPEVEVYSFQVDDITRQMDRIPEDCNLIRLGKTFKNWEDTACAMNCMDLMVTTDNGVMNLAGALGVTTTFILSGRLPYRPLSPLWEEMERMGCILTRPTADTIRCTGKLKPGDYVIDGGVSSQFITGLFLICFG